MARSNKTSSVLRLIGAPDLKIKKTEQTDNNYQVNANETQPQSLENDIGTSKKRSRNKTVIKNPEMSKLVGNSAPNPVLKQAGADEPIYRRHGSERQIVNVSAFLVCEQIGPALERFNSCSCDTCCRVITERALSLMPDCFVHVNAKPDEDKVNGEIKRLRPEAIKILTRLCITARTRPYHRNEE